MAGVADDELPGDEGLLRGVLGLKLVDEDPGVAVFHLPGGEHDFVEVIDAAGPEAAAVSTGPVPGLLVDDVVAAQAELEAAGVEIVEPVCWWEFLGSDLPEIPGYGWFEVPRPRRLRLLLHARIEGHALMLDWLEWMR